jgi:hypothetical protein
MRVATGNDAAATGAAAAGGQVGLVEAHPVLGQGVYAGGLDMRMAVTSKVILGDIIRDEKNNVGLFD